MSIDYRALLKKYVCMVASIEGVTYIGSPVSPSECIDGFSTEEWNELCVIDDEVEADFKAEGCEKKDA